MSMTSSRTTAILIGCLIISVGLNVPMLIEQIQKLFADDVPESFEVQALAASDDESSITIMFSEGGQETTITRGDAPNVFILKRDGKVHSWSANERDEASVYVLKRDGVHAHVMRDKAHSFKLKRDGSEIKLEGLEELSASHQVLREALQRTQLELKSLSDGEGHVRIQGLSSGEGGTFTFRSLSEDNEASEKKRFRVIVKPSDNE